MTVSLVAVLGMTGLLAAGGSVRMLDPDASDAAQEPAAMTALFAPGGSGTETQGPRTELAQAAAPAPQTLPGGATSLSESYQDWQVSCGIVNRVRHCSISQTQMQQNTGQRVLAVELGKPEKDGSVTGTLVMPFGLALDTGVTLQIDDRGAGKPLRFRTCLPEGCVVPLSFDAATVASLREGTALKVKARADDGSEAALSVSLKGFGPALDRVVALDRP